MGRRLVVLTIGLLILTGCGASPVAVGPGGVDGLTIPTPSPRPQDFTARVDNPWFPLNPGTTWVYRRYSDTALSRVVVRVLPGSHDVDGVPTTAVSYAQQGAGRTAARMVRWYAEDRAGNVWWFGQRVAPGTTPLDPLATVSWRAGRDGAEPGLMMAATPRAGDGYLNGYRPGRVERRTTITSLAATIALPHRHYRHAVSSDDGSDLDPSVRVQSFFARGVGLVAQQQLRGGSGQLSLLRVRTG